MSLEQAKQNLVENQRPEAVKLQRPERIRRMLLEVVDELSKYENEGFKGVWDRMKSMPWSRYTIRHLKRILEERQKTMPQLKGEDLDDYACRLVQNIGPAVNESMMEFPKGKVIVYDLKGYSKFQKFIDPVRRRQQDREFQRLGKRLCKLHGVTMIQPIAGDKMVFFMPDSGHDERNQIRLQNLLKSFFEEPLSTGLELDELIEIGLNPEEYPGCNFMASIGVAQAEEGELILGTVMGHGSHDQGGSVILGSAYVRALQCQGSSGGNQVAFDDSIAAILDESNLVFGESSKTPGLRVIEDVKEVKPAINFLEKDDLKLPKDPVMKRALMFGLGCTLHQRGSFSDVLATTREASKAVVENNMERQTQSNNLGVTTIFLSIGEEEEMGTKPEAFVRALNEAVDLLNDPRFKDLYVAKMDEHYLIIQTRKHPELMKDIIPAFNNELSERLSQPDIDLKLTGGVSRDEMMTTTTCDVYGRAFARDGAGKGYVEAARLAKAHDSGLPSFRYSFAWTRAAGLSGEHLSLPTKGGTILMLGAEPGQGGWQTRELVEMDQAREDLDSRFRKVRSEGNIIQIAPSLRKAVEGQSGLGVSALARDLAVRNEYVVSLMPQGNGTMPLTRSLVDFLGEEHVEQLDEEDLQAKFEFYLTEDLEFLTAAHPVYFMLDQNHITDVDRHNLHRFFDAVRGQDTALVHTLEDRFEGGQEPVYVYEKTAKGMAEIIYQQRPDISKVEKERHLTGVITAVETFFKDYPSLIRGPRLAFKLAQGMTIDVRGVVKLPDPNEFEIGQGEAGVRIEQSLHSPQARRLLNLLAVVGTYISVDDLHLLARKFLGWESKEMMMSIVEQLFEHNFVRESEEGIKLLSLDLQDAAELMFDDLMKDKFRKELAEFILENECIEKPFTDLQSIEVTQGNIFAMEAWWEQEMRRRELSESLLRVTHSIVMFYYRSENIEAAGRCAEAFYKLVGLSGYEDYSSEYLDFARVFIELGVHDLRKTAVSIYDRASQSRSDLEFLEAVWYRDYRLPTMDKKFLNGNGLSQEWVDRLKDPEAAEALRLISLLSVFKKCKASVEARMDNVVVTTALEVEELYRTLILQKHLKEANYEALIERADDLEARMGQNHFLPESADRMTTEAFYTAKRLLGGIFKQLATKKVPNERPSFYMKSAQSVDGMRQALRDQSRPDFVQARESMHGYGLYMTYYFLFLFNTSPKESLEANAAELRKAVHQLQRELIEGLSQFLKEGASFLQRDSMLLSLENAFYVEVLLESKLASDDVNMEKISQMTVGGYRWARSERKKLLSILGRSEAYEKQLDGAENAMRKMVNVYLQEKVRPYDEVSLSRPHLDQERSKLMV